MNTLKKYKYYTLLAVLYTSMLFATLVVENRVIHFGGMAISSATLILPLSYALGDVIAEVYGYRMSRQLIWYTVISLIVSTLLISLLMQIDTEPEYNHYKSVLSMLPRNVISYIGGTLISSFLNVYILTKWKAIVKGKYFWLRSLTSTAIGEALFIITMGSIAFIGLFPSKTIVQLMVASYIVKIIYNIIAITPTALLVKFLKKSEQVNVYDYKTDFNPFSLQA